jgi:hypothetical protein
MIEKAKTLNTEAGDVFWTVYIQPLLKETIGTSTAIAVAEGAVASTAELTTSTTKNLTAGATTTAAEGAETSAAATTTATTVKNSDTNKNTAVPENPSVKNLIKSAFQNIKDAYQIFIDMSNLIKEFSDKSGVRG